METLYTLNIIVITGFLFFFIGRQLYNRGYIAGSNKRYIFFKNKFGKEFLTGPSLSGTSEENDFFLIWLKRVRTNRQSAMADLIAYAKVSPGQVGGLLAYLKKIEPDFVDEVLSSQKE